MLLIESSSFLYLRFILIILLTFFLLYRISQSLWALRLVMLFTALVVLSPFLFLIAKRGYQTLFGFNEAGHSIKYVILITVDTLRADVIS